jgi:nucleoside-diphosphate-sugar epimerase
VFGENNRGNVFNLFKQISSGKFIMIGDGLNRKSLAYVDNVSSFIEYSLFSKSGLHIYNYVDKPDLNMNTLVSLVQKILGKSSGVDFRIPFFIGLFIGYFFDFLGKISGKKFNISSIRIKKFCSNSVYTSAVELTDFIAPVPLIEGIEKTVCYEFIENRINDHNVDS